MAVDVREPVAFSPQVQAGDACAEYWLRQAMLRLRREVTWLRHERGAAPGGETAWLPPLVDQAQMALDLSRHAREKRAFYRQDPTARYLCEQLERGRPPCPDWAPSGSFGWVSQVLNLDELAQFVLGLGLLAALDSAAGSVFAACLNDPAATRPTLALAQRLWDEPGQVLALADPAHALFRYGLLAPARADGAGQADVDWEAPLVVPALVARQVLFPDMPLPPGLAPLPERRAAEPLSEGASVVAVRLAAHPPAALQIVPIRGEARAAHAATAAAVSAAAQGTLVRFDAEAAPPGDERYLTSLATVCWLRGLDLFMDAPAVRAEAAGHAPGAWALPARSIPLRLYLAVSARAQIPSLPAAHLMPIVEVPALSYAGRLEHWRKALGDRARGLDAEMAEIARRFRYERATIDAICEGLAAVGQPLTGRLLSTACRAELEMDLGDLAQPVIPRFHAEKLILPPKQARQFREVVRAMRALTEVHYGWGTATAWNEGGITALFAGPPGTGKTMGAEILAAELDLPMYRIDLSQVVNKYIGETEKNLKRLFDAADLSDIILFFDEADALFGQRTEVKDAHDRYANLEISYLLERMERFKGLAILATNRKKDLDEAFLRRLRYIIDFPLPDEKQRRDIWRQVVPPGVDVSGVDFSFLARQFPLAGGHIRSIVFNACLQSAGNDGQPSGAPRERRLGMPEIVVAVRREYDKLNRPVSLEQFGLYAAVIESLEVERDTDPH